MLHKIMIGLVAVAAIAVTAMPTDVSARGRGGVHGFRGGHIGVHAFRGGFRYTPYVGVYSYGYSCWRWVTTAVGPRRVYVCGYGYPYY